TLGSTTKRFDPLYGTPHKFWGYMDYFYVGTGSPTGGLQNIYVKTKYAAKDFSVALDIHNFQLANLYAGGPAKKNLGYEFDLIANYNLNKFTNLELGYCVMLANDQMEKV